jgi:hypothetical protein
VTFVGAAAAVRIAPLVPAIAGADPVRVAVTPVESPAWLLGCHEVDTTPVELVEPEVGLNDVVNPVVGYPPGTEKVTGTPGWVELEVAVTVSAAPPAVYVLGGTVGEIVTTIVGAVSV